MPVGSMSIGEIASFIRKLYFSFRFISISLFLNSQTFPYFTETARKIHKKHCISLGILYKYNFIWWLGMNLLPIFLCRHRIKPYGKIRRQSKDVQLPLDLDMSKMPQLSPNVKIRRPPWTCVEKRLIISLLCYIAGS